MTKRICSCGKIVLRSEECSTCSRNAYQKQYYQRKKDIIKPLNTTRWRKLRSIIISRDGGRCQRCYIKNGRINGAQLQVHHIIPRIKNPDLMFEESNLITLCKTCNLEIGIGKLDFEPTIDLEDIDYNFKL